MRVWFVCLFLLAGCLDAGPAPDVEDSVPSIDAAARADVEAVSSSPMVRLTTDHGTVDLLVYQHWMPATAGRFLALVDAGFYDGVQFHRVIPGFVIQSGDPTGTGTGGSGSTIPHEFDDRLVYVSGGVGMARSAELDSADSQWFITTHPATRMSEPNGSYAEQHGTYAMFAQVVDGFDVVRSISGVMTVPEQDRPVVPVLVQSATRIDNTVDPAAYPLQAIELAGHTVSMPLHLFENHPFTMLQEMSGSDALVVGCLDDDGLDHRVLLHHEMPEPLEWPSGAMHCTFAAGDETLERTFHVGGAL